MSFSGRPMLRDNARYYAERGQVPIGALRYPCRATT